MAEALVSAPLSPETNESIFRNDILPDYLPETMRRVDRPRLILLGGQPGAGKTAVLIASHTELEQSSSTIRIVGDDLRSYHPRFLAFQRQDPETASQFTQGDAGRWTEKLLAASAVRHVNIVFETTMRTPENVARVIGIARDAGYEVEARAVAVNPRSSWQGNHYRFEELLHLGAAARIPPQHIHDAAVDGLRVSLEKLESEHLVDRVQLLTRGGSVLYENEMRDCAWLRRPRARQALEEEQTRPMTRPELQRFADDWDYVLSRMEERGGSDARIAAVRTRAVEDVNFLLAQRRDFDGEKSPGQGRTIFQNHADALGLFGELYDNAVRDAERRPIGNIEAHAIGRLLQTYTALKLIEAARNLGLLPEHGKIVTTQGIVHDKRGWQEFPAAHRLPADLSVEMPDGSRRRLTEHLDGALNRVAVDREVFGRTDRLSRIANVADSWFEAAGMRKTLARAAHAVDSGERSADAAMAEIVEPGYSAAIARARSRLDRNMAVVERAAIATAIVDASGEPFRTVREDLLLRTANLENRARAKAMMVTVLDETARQRQLDPAQRRAADAFIRGISETERKLDGRRALDRDVVRTDALAPARHLPDLTEPEIDDRLRDSSRLADKRAEIENLSRLVFGNGRAASAAAQGIIDTRSGYAAADNVREGKLADLAGERETWLRAPSSERQTAEANAPRLAAALADYGLAVDFERHQIVTRHCEEQARQRVEIPPPSSVLAATLALGKDEKRRRFEGNADLRRELDRLSSAIDKRLTHANKADLKNESLVKLASDPGIGVGQARSLHQTSNLIARAQDNVRRLDRDRGRLTQLQIRR
jgi:hypothetical protein